MEMIQKYYGVFLFIMKMIQIIMEYLNVIN